MVYNKVKESGKKFEIIYVDFSKDETAWQEYVENMPWLALPFGDKHAKDLASALDVTGKAHQIIIIETVDPISRDGPDVTYNNALHVCKDLEKSTILRLLTFQFPYKINIYPVASRELYLQEVHVHVIDH